MLSSTVVDMQMRSRANNLWVNKRGEPLGPRPDGICADGPFLRMHWMNVLLWLAMVGTDAMVFASWHRWALSTCKASCVSYKCAHIDIEA